VTLSPADDHPIHQVAQPIRHAGTSDRNFYDRYYFNAHKIDGSALVIAGMGQYPNLGITDAFVAVLSDGEQRVVRASRVLGVDRMDSSVGPIRVEVIEGLRRLRLVLEPNEWGLACDLTFDGGVHPHEEPQQIVKTADGKAILDTFRMVQTGTWSGALSVDGTEISVTPGEWWGVRDRSWGVRPVGEPEPPGINATRGGSFYWIYAPLRFADFTIVTIVQEDADGRRIMEDATKVWNLGPDGRPAHPDEYLGSPEVDLEFEPGTRAVTGASIRFSRSPLTVRIDPMMAMHIGVGSGYGFDGDWRHGEFRGDLWVDGVEFHLDDPEDAKKMWGIVDTVPRAETSDGDVGHGLFESLLLGPHARHGWKDLLDAP